MKLLITSIVGLLPLSALLIAQAPAPNKSGVSVALVHLIVRNPEEHKKLWADMLGAQVTSSGSLELLKLPGLFVSLEKGEPIGPSNGSSVNHVGLWIKDYDGNGIWDLAIGAPEADGPGDSRADAGDAYVIFGRAGLPANLVPDTTIYGAAAGLHTGGWIRSGDITKDEPDDLALLASGGNGGAGVVYVVYGRPRDQYPTDARTAGRLGSLIEKLLPHYVDRFRDSPRDVREIRTDAGIRLWLLSALALRRGSPQSLSLAAKAFTTSPTSLGAFIAKVGGRLTER